MNRKGRCLYFHPYLNIQSVVLIFHETNVDNRGCGGSVDGGSMAVKFRENSANPFLLRCLPTYLSVWCWEYPKQNWNWSLIGKAPWCGVMWDDFCLSYSVSRQRRRRRRPLGNCMMYGCCSFTVLFYLMLHCLRFKLSSGFHATMTTTDVVAAFAVGAQHHHLDAVMCTHFSGEWKADL